MITPAASGTPGGPCVCARIQVLRDRQAREDCITLRSEGDSTPDDAGGLSTNSVGATSTDLVSLEEDRAILPTSQTDDGAEHGGFPMAIETNEAETFARVHRQTEVVEHPHGPVACRDAFEFQDRHQIAASMSGVSK